ncbi:hypothetical protein HY572_00255 [Candidatus Micrarchaeota archaeon]|nr:hypothetical protein [Candidatus Micrarchaeota archaeon]
MSDEPEKKNDAAPRKRLDAAKGKVAELRIQNRQAIEEVKALHENAKKEKELRDAENQAVKNLKKAWQDQEHAAAHIKQELAAARKQTDAVPRGQNPQRLKAELEQLEWVQQTEALSKQEDREISKKVKAILKALPEAETASGTFQKIRELEKTLYAANDSARKTRQEMSQHAKKSDDHHKNHVTLLKKANSLSKKITERFKELDEKRAALMEEEQKIRDERKAERDSAKADREALKTERQHANTKAREKARLLAGKVLEKIKNGGKLTLEDLQIIQEAGIDLTA